MPPPRFPVTICASLPRSAFSDAVRSTATLGIVGRIIIVSFTEVWALRRRILLTDLGYWRNGWEPSSRAMSSAPTLGRPADRH